MGCQQCDDATNVSGIMLYYFRWKNADIALAGCHKHITEVIYVLRKEQERRMNDTEKTNGNETTSDKDSST